MNKPILTFQIAKLLFLPLIMEALVTGIAEWDKITRQVILEYASNRVFVLEGEVGSGKTSFCKSFCKQLGYNGSVTSPTFNIINEYKNNDGSTVFHFDFYRIKHAKELIEIDVFSYLDSGNYCLIEWGLAFTDIIPPNAILLRFKHFNTDSRLFSASTLNN